MTNEPRDPLHQVRQDLAESTNKHRYPTSHMVYVGVRRDLLQILIDEHDQLSIMEAYNVSCRKCAQRIDAEADQYLEMDEYVYEMATEGWGWQ
ncbi:hypothetical protein SEA_SIXAMA_9 [Gordonia phage Sixama]|uniref:Uncharacterized protein n=1 Tax=Gordonia phage Sixama TaxID=2653271 RepID=A0A5Q2F1P7_9CAUD|nr:hypothetical protein PP302_gp009 [Gordonia phage Sixama]QGF20188.1 hypothetical protein SEA_SIXAMA_9 [Gordonia phage Sixama]